MATKLRTTKSSTNLKVTVNHNVLILQIPMTYSTRIQVLYTIHNLFYDHSCLLLCESVDLFDTFEKVT